MQANGERRVPVTSNDVRLAVDIGGTFTDGVAEIVETGELVVAKRLTTYPDPSAAVSDVIGELVSGVGDLGRERGVAYSYTEVVHGTTLVANSIIERVGAKVALLVTEGTRDVLKLGRECRYDLYDLDLPLPEPLVPEGLVFEVSARMDSHGRIVRELDESSVRAGVRQMKAVGVTAIAVSLLHAYLNPVHETRIHRILREEFPEVHVSLSSRVASEPREFERTSTTVANAFVQPLTSHYLGRLKARLLAHEVRAPLRVMISSGGFISDETAAQVPIELLESGPAGGVRSAANTAENLKIDRILTFDMGGTTAKACVCLEGVPELTYNFEAARVARFRKGSGLPILVPSIDLIEVGAGGGSIAYKNHLGLLKVGPQSAGSQPGPACYRLGGSDPTVTDADLLLGFLDPDTFLGGEMKLDTQEARRAIASLGDAFGLSVAETAWGIHNVVSENMAAAARVHVAEKGLDPRSLTLVATGGAGPVHAVEVAARLGIRRVVFTLAAGVGSCLGFLASPVRVDRSWSYLERMDMIDLGMVQENIDRIEAGIRDDLELTSIDETDTVWSLGIEMRYAGQGHNILVSRPLETITGDLVLEMADDFEARYERSYGTRIPDGIPQSVTWRVTAESTSRAHRFRLLARTVSRDKPVSAGTRHIFDVSTGGFKQVPVYERHGLIPGSRMRGPLILTESESTIVIARPSTVSVTEDGTIDVEIDQVQLMDRSMGGHSG